MSTYLQVHFEKYTNLYRASQSGPRTMLLLSKVFCLAALAALGGLVRGEDALEVTKLLASDGAAHDYFGTVAVDGPVAIVGAEGENDWQGAAYTYKKGGDGAWGETAKLVADDGAARAYFGHAVAISGDVAVVGAIGNDEFTGAAYVYRTVDGGDTWTQEAKLLASDYAAGAQFGTSVAIDGDAIVVGAPRADSSAGAA